MNAQNIFFARFFEEINFKKFDFFLFDSIMISFLTMTEKVKKNEAQNRQSVKISWFKESSEFEFFSQSKK